MQDVLLVTEYFHTVVGLLLRKENFWGLLPPLFELTVKTHCVKGSQISLCAQQPSMIHRHSETSSSNTGPAEGRSSPPLMLCGMKTDFPSQLRVNHTLKNVTHFYCKHGKHANARTHIQNCVPVENPRVSFWPWSTLDTRTGAPAYINGAFLFGGGKSHTHTYTRCAREHTHRATPSHTPTLQPSVNVKPWERGFILERDGIFTPSVTASLSLSHTHTHTGSSNTARPVKGKPWPWYATSHKNTKTLERLCSETSFHVFESLTKCQDQSQCGAGWVTLLKTPARVKESKW